MHTQCSKSRNKFLWGKQRLHITAPHTHAILCLSCPNLQTCKYGGHLQPCRLPAWPALATNFQRIPKGTAPGPQHMNPCAIQGLGLWPPHIPHHTLSLSCRNVALLQAGIHGSHLQPCHVFAWKTAANHLCRIPWGKAPDSMFLSVCTTHGLGLWPPHTPHWALHGMEPTIPIWFERTNTEPTPAVMSCQG